MQPFLWIQQYQGYLQMLNVKLRNSRSSEPVANAEYNISVHFLLILSFWVTCTESIVTLRSCVEAKSADELADTV